jgi:PAS domain S-box-containing protein
LEWKEGLMMRSTQRGSIPSNPSVTTKSAASQRVPRRRPDIAHQFEALVQLAPDATVVVDGSGRIRLVNHKTEELFGYSADELLGQPVELLVPERLWAVHQQHRATYASAPYVRPMGASLPLSGRRRDGSEFSVEASLGPLDERDEALVIVSIRDITERQLVHTAAEAANQDLRALQALSDTALSHLSLEDLLPALLERITDILTVDNAAVLLLDEAGQTLTVQAVVGLEEPWAARVRVALGQGFAGRIAASREALVVNDVFTFPVANPLLREQLHSVAGVPLVIGNQVLGVLHVGTALPRHFTARDVQLLQQVADRMALAIDRARLYTREQQAREQADAALAQAQASEHRFQQLVEANIVGVVVSDTERIFEANDEYLRVVGYTREDLEAGRLRYDRLKSPDTYPLAERVIQELLTTGVSTAIEREYIRKDGSRIPVLVAGIVLQRDPPRFASFVFDLTERKRLERERTEQAEQLDRIFEGIADGVGVYDTQAQLVRLNAAARRILGLDAVPAEYAQRPLSDRVSLFEARDGQDRSIAHEDWPLVRVLSGQATGADMREVRLRTLDGREVELSIGVAPLRDGEGRLTGAVGIFRDQTEQKRLAREREEARAHELALEDTARHMDEFLATASHDLRTPLTVVKSRLQIALRRLTRLQDSAAASPNALLETDLEAVRESLLAANQSADRLTHLVALLFDVSRARSGTLELQLAPCDLTVLVREQVATQQMVALDRKIELVVPDSPVVRVLADADRLSQVLGNYVSNALKYSSADQPVTVRLEVAENRAVVSVADHGPGILVEEQNRIWELFHRVPGIEVQSWSGETSGSLGLGLHICKQLIELHPGGRVGVESTVGAGSTFWFQLPLVSYSEFH